MVVDATQLGEQNPNPLGAGRDLQFEEFFHREAKDQVIGERRQIVDAVGQGNDLGVVKFFGVFLDAGVQEADVGRGAQDSLAVKFQDEPQDAVGRGVLRPHVESHGLSGNGRGSDGLNH